MKIHEPATVITDGLIVLCAGWFSGQLLAPSGNPFYFWWGIAYLTMALGAALGAIRHGWGPLLGTQWSISLNRGTYAVIGLTAGSMVLATVIHYYSETTVLVITVLLVLSWLIYLIIAIRKMSFSVVVFYYFPALIITVSLTARHYFDQRLAGEAWIVAGLIISILAGIVQLGKVAPHPRFNHNDLYHVIQLVGLFVIYHGIRLL